MNDFWAMLDQLVANSKIKIDRPKGSAHPSFPSKIYPLDYGYLVETFAMDDSGIDVWVGSLEEKTPVAIICTIDLWKRDAELKIMLGCTEDELQTVLVFLNQGSQGGVLVRREND